MIAANDLIVFQGDSITDGDRDRSRTAPNDPHAMGGSYAFHVAAGMLRARPHDHLAFYNRGVSGNQVTHLAERWTRDCLDLKPNLLSILIGVNDTWHGIQHGDDRRVPVDRYAAVYRRLLEDARAALPDVKLVLCDPFVLLCGDVSEAWLPEINQRRQVVGELCEAFGARRVDFQRVFDDAAAAAPAEYWLHDGVHPTMAGHRLMADAWLEAVCG